MRLKRILLHSFTSLSLALISGLSWQVPGHAWVGPGANHPERQWQQFETPHFIIHYYQGYEDFSRLVARVVEDGYDKLSADLGVTPKEKIPIIITQDEFWNGYAEPARNRIVLDPRFSLVSTIGVNRFILHELTHILNFMAVQDPHPVSKLSKAASLPSWFTEGLAQYEAEYWAPENDRMLRLDLLANKMLTPAERNAFIRLSGKGSAGYNEGYGLVKYIFETYGHDKVKVLLSQYRDHYGDFYQAMYETFHKTYLELDAEWRQNMALRYRNQTNAREVNIKEAKAIMPYRAGRTYFRPRYSPDGQWVSYLYSGGYPLIRGHVFNIMSLRVTRAADFEKWGGQLHEISEKEAARNEEEHSEEQGLQATPAEEKEKTKQQTKEAQDKLKELESKLVERGVMDFAWHPQGGAIAYTHLHPDPDGNSTTAVSLLRLKTNEKQQLVADGEPELLTKDWAAHSPTWSPDGKTLALVQETQERDAVVLLDPQTKSLKNTLLKAPDFRQYQALEWSPDGQHLVLEAFLPGEGSNLLLLNPQTQSLRQITESDSMYGDRFPSWSPDSQALYYISTRTGYPDLFRYQLKTQNEEQLSTVYTGIDTPMLRKTPSGDQLYFIRHHVQGTSVEQIATEKLTPSGQTPAQVEDGFFARDLDLTPLPSLEFKPQKYVPWLAPEVVVPIFGRDEEGDQLGFLAQFSDLLQQHAVNILLLYGIASQRVGYSAAYINRIFDTSFAIEIADSPLLSFTTDGEFFFIQRDRHLSFLLNRPLFNPGTGDTSATRMQRFASLELTIAHQINLREELVGEVDARQLREGFNNSLALSFTAEEGRSDDGFRYNFNISGGSPLWGSQFSYIAGSADFRQYIPVFNTHSIAYRLGATALRGETRPALLGGAPLSNLLVLNFQDIIPLRGFRIAELQGQYLLASQVEYRFPIFSELNLNWDNHYLRDLTAAAFIDAGDAWYGSKRSPFPHIAAGFELRANAILNTRNSFQLFLGAGKAVGGLNNDQPANLIFDRSRPIEFYGGFANVF